MLSSVDFGILIVYFILVTGIGFYVSKRASKSLNEYFLGGRHIPWYILGVSGMATFLSLCGSMHIVSLFFLFGVKGFWVTFRGHMVMLLAFLMIFLAKWLNRSGVMTNAEWAEFRFGSDTQGRTARMLSAVSTLVMAVATMSFFFIVAEKFLALYIPISPQLSALLFFAIVMSYTVRSGFYGVVFTDLFQNMLIVIVIGFITIKALMIGTPEYFARFATPGWREMTPSWIMEMPNGYENMKLFGLLIFFWIISSVFMGFAQPTDGFVSQRYYAAKNERESGLIAWQWILLLSLRFLMMAGIAVLALGIADSFTDPEQAFPAVVNHYFPVGLKGLVLAALIAAEMSSLDSIANSASAYVVKDIYQLYINPGAIEKSLVRVGYIATTALFILSAVVGMSVPNLNSLWAWIVMGLVTGILPQSILKWFWWRLNGMGYAFGIGAGILSAVIHSLVFNSPPEYVTFLFVLGISTIGTVIGTLTAKPSDIHVLKTFYMKTRPFGFWEPVRAVCDSDFVAGVRQENRRDLMLLIPACLWQVLLFWTMTALVMKKWESLTFSLIAVLILSGILYKFWYKNLSE